MLRASVFAITGAIGLVGAMMAAEGPMPKAHADIRGAGVSGRLELVEAKVGTGREVEVRLTVSGLKPGLHGVHLHAVGRCEEDFTTAGGHFDPGPAGNPDPDANHPFHMGDLPNVSVAANGEGKMVGHTTRVTLSDGPLSLFDADGAAIVVHANQDQEMTGPPKSGVSGGPRVACGLITRN
jgi:Cu-Zn family superoxide dismutase